MKVTRREALKTGATAAAGLGLGTVETDARQGRDLAIVVSGLVAAVIDRAPGGRGVPSSAKRTDLIMVNAPRHVPRLAIPGGWVGGKPRTLKLDGCDLEILVNGQPLGATGVSLINNTRARKGNGFAANCPQSDAERADLSWIADVEMAAGSSNVDASCVSAKPPIDRVAARVTLQAGTLGAEPARLAATYWKNEWEFLPSPSSKYQQTFGEMFGWIVEDLAGQITLQTREFATNTVRESVNVTPNGDPAIVTHLVPPLMASKDEDVVMHFVYYYSLLSVVPKQLPVPFRTTVACKVAPVMTARLASADKLMHGLALHGEPGICYTSVMYHQF